MNPLPSEENAARPRPERPRNPLPAVLPGAPTGYSSANRRATSCPVQRAYPWLLFASVAVAGTFCALYLTKPVIVAGDAPEASVAAAAEAGSPPSAVAPDTSEPMDKPLLPTGDALPGDRSAPLAAGRGTDSPLALEPPSPTAEFEETNLRVQHILTAETQDGASSRIVLDVPVLYHSRNLLWTAAEASEARALLDRLADYQEKSLALRAEGMELLDSWNALVERGIPSGVLRADSPSLPGNQGDASTPPPPGLDTTEAVRIGQPASK